MAETVEDHVEENSLNPIKIQTISCVGMAVYKKYLSQLLGIYKEDSSSELNPLMICNTEVSEISVIMQQQIFYKRNIRIIVLLLGTPECSSSFIRYGEWARPLSLYTHLLSEGHPGFQTI